MKDFLKQLIFPNKCILCRTILNDQTVGHLCDACYSLVLRHDVCHKWGMPYQASENDCVYALFPYNNQYRKAVLRWKYRGIRKYAKIYADLLVNDLCFLNQINIDALVPVPLSASRQRKRGFNQALDLANEISKLTDIPVYDILKRSRNTKPQSKCSKKERLQNLKGSMSLKDKAFKEISSIALVDDIYTTGATIRECIRAIQEKQSSSKLTIYVIVVCIGV